MGFPEHGRRDLHLRGIANHRLMAFGGLRIVCRIPGIATRQPVVGFGVVGRKSQPFLGVADDGVMLAARIGVVVSTPAVTGVPLFEPFDLFEPFEPFDPRSMPSSVGIPAKTVGSVTFSRAVMFAKRRMFWKVRPRPAVTMSFGRAVLKMPRRVRNLPYHAGLMTAVIKVEMSSPSPTRMRIWTRFSEPPMDPTRYVSAQVANAGTID